MMGPRRRNDYAKLYGAVAARTGYAFDAIDRMPFFRFHALLDALEDQDVPARTR